MRGEETMRLTHLAIAGGGVCPVAGRGRTLAAIKMALPETFASGVLHHPRPCRQQAVSPTL